MIRLNPAREIIPLQLLGRGEFAEVSELVGLPEHVHRLNELGLSSGAVIEMLQPGSPCIIRLAGQKLCFRETDSMGILVRTGVTD